MSTVAMEDRRVHHGRNIKRLRDMLGLTQDAVAFEMDITQQSFSDIEQKELVDDKMLDKIAQIMKVPVEAIKNMTDDTTYSYINTFNEAVTNHNGFYNFNCSFNPIEKIVELYNEKAELYERMIKEKDEVNTLLQKLLAEKK